jgi:hypothetical protein
MNYELAKQLKDAGFNQRENGYKLFREEGWKWNEPNYFNGNDRTMEEKYFSQDYVKEHLDWLVVIPTLSELIESCGDKFGSLVLDKKEYKCYHTQPIPDESGLEDTRWSKTPEEAVANLWLSLNQK